MQNTNAKEMLERFQNGECSEEELAIIQSWYNQFESEPTEKLTLEAWEYDIPEIYRVLEDKLSGTHLKKVRWYRYVAAASVVLTLSIGGYFLIAKPEITAVANNTKHDILPGGNRAVLTLSGGKQIILTDVKNGKLATETNAIVSKTADGELTYTAENKNPQETLYNTLSTPLGGQYALTLSDGTKVTLNAGSTLRYPTTFAGHERRVELTGEAYFEVAHNALMPFDVISKSQSIRVLGTHFNVNTYEDEPASKTTLLEGSVLINQKFLLKPGQQAISSGISMQVSNVDTEIAVAWKDNKFMFDQSDLTSIMRMISRWYNVSVDYNGPISTSKFGGSVSKFKNVSEVLKLLERTGEVHFKIKERRIVVTK